MKKLLFIFAAIVIGFSVHPGTFADASPEKSENEQKVEKPDKHHHRLIEEDKVKELTEKGFTKEEIFTGAILAKKADKSVDDVLTIYKEKKTWENTAKELGVDLEELKKINSMVEWNQFLENHEGAVIDYLAAYSNKKPEDIQAYLDDKMSLRFLIGAAAMAKLSNKDLDEIISMKKEGQSFHNIISTLNIKHEDLHNELKEFKKGVEEKVKDGSSEEAKE
ncbi:hypothetical protein [Bacillus dakarensis]|uniref:hypothetical protein n=1 Tax=Robertmurraya dakarensis TaxID=1926278 RepID=UPI000981AB8B|nr:hypothetical protein [Bacillus dakarensis]